MQNHAVMSGPPPPPPPPPSVSVEWNASSGFQNEHLNVPPPPGVSSAPSTLQKPSFSWSPVPGLSNQLLLSHRSAVRTGVYQEHTPAQATFVNANESPQWWPATPSRHSPAVVYLQHSLLSHGQSDHGALSFINGTQSDHGALSFINGTQSASYRAQNIIHGPIAHNSAVSYFSSNIPSAQNPFSVQQLGSLHDNDVSKRTNLDKIDVKDVIPNLRGLIAQVNESVRKILNMMKVEPDTLPLKSLDPQAVGSRRQHSASHSVIEDCVNHRSSFESMQMSNDFITASTIFNNILTSSRKSSDNAFYKDAPGVVQVPVQTIDESLENSELPDFAMGERWDELTLQSFGTDRQVHGTLLPSRYWLVCKEISEWNDLPKKLTSYQVKAIAGLTLVQRADLKKWLLIHGSSYGVTCSRSLAEHIMILLVFCLRAVYREATGLIDSGEEIGFVDCRTLAQTASWLSTQLWSLGDAVCNTNLVLGLYKYALKMAAYYSVRALWKSSLEGLQEEKPIMVDGMKSLGVGLEQEPCNDPCTSSEACTDQSIRSSFVGDGVLCLQHLVAAILAIHAQGAHEKCRASDLLSCSSDQRLAVHTMITNKAVEVRGTQTNYRAVLEHDGLMWQRPQNQESKANKSKEELLAEERDYKRRRMSYRGKKVQRTPTEVLRDIIEGHMEDIVAAGGIGCIGRRPPELETLSAASGAKDHTVTSQKSRSSSRDAASKELQELHPGYRDYRYSRSESRESFRTERGEGHRSNSMSLRNSSQRYDQSYQERSESLLHIHSGDKSSERKYESNREHSRWESKARNERHHSSKYYSRVHD